MVMEVLVEWGMDGVERWRDNYILPKNLNITYGFLSYFVVVSRKDHNITTRTTFHACVTPVFINAGWH